jgi:hypothetical protein
VSDALNRDYYAPSSGVFLCRREPGYNNDNISIVLMDQNNLMKRFIVSDPKSEILPASLLKSDDDNIIADYDQYNNDQDGALTHEDIYKVKLTSPLVFSLYGSLKWTE